MKRFYLLPGFILLFSCFFGGTTGAQSLDDVKKKILEALESIEQTPCIRMDVVYRDSKTETKATVNVLGDKIWQEFDTVPIADKEASLNKKKRIREIMDCELPVIHAFDGKNAYTFNPYQLELEIKPSSKYPTGGLFLNAALPKGWVAFDHDGNVLFKELLLDGKFIKENNLGSVIKEISDGKWQVTQTRRLPGMDSATVSRQFVLDWSFVVTRDSKYLPVEYKRVSGDGITYTGTLTWADQEGRSFLREAIHRFDGQINQQWVVNSIEFDAKKCRDRFDNLEESVPKGTKITRRDAKRKIVSEAFKGGSSGKEEFELKKLAVMRSNLLERTDK